MAGKQGIWLQLCIESVGEGNSRRILAFAIRLD